MSESADNGLQLYKREPLPPLTKDGETSQSDGEAEGVKGKASNNLAKGAGLFKTSRFGAIFQKMKLPGHRRRPKSPNQEEQSGDVDELKIEDSDNDTPRLVPKNVKPPQSDVEMEGKKSGSRSTTGDIDMEGLSSSPDLSLPTHFPSPLPEYLSSLSPPSPHSSSGSAPPPAPPPAPPLPPSSGDSSPSKPRKVVNSDDSEKSSSVSATSKTNSRPEVQRPIIDISEANLKPVVQRPKPQYPPKPPSYQFKLRKTAHDGSKDQVSTNKITDQETDAQESSTSYQQKSPKSKIPPAVLARPDMKLVQEARERANLLTQ
ncbi:hypothetical protein BSLG_008211 [Batrachochytrium salamandrivorans]|nr:hypothetical protein BSLG_008211 [Batrachochytrium salamandrivorans]